MSVFSKVFGWIGGKVKSIYQAVKAAVTSDAMKSLLEGALGDIARAGIAKAASASGVSDIERFKIAFDEAKAKAAVKGLEVKDSALGLVIQAVIATVKHP